ncbi:MAG: VPLPA-CTERM sorting domain-containing protein [Litoreibacter sp.]|nr:VPLPA-CTERM sorting domain-containing protein [Litoreibacter sp.]MCY4334227.1 VPLPA-CTERM sorting domain-containing protein [Litoreibacter sp.]
MFKHLLAAIALLATSAGAIATPVQWNSGTGANGHYYEVITRGMTFEQAKAYAASQTFNGMQGYLATVTSADENAFISGLTGNHWSWLGGERIGRDNTFQWIQGPEAGTVFYDDGAVTGVFNAFARNEPNNWRNTNEDAVHIWGGGTWNDLRKSKKIRTVIEYSAVPAVPLPASGLLLLAGVGAMFLRGRKTKA